MSKNFSISCPQCNEVQYLSYKSYWARKKTGATCRKCADKRRVIQPHKEGMFIRNCQQCNAEQRYSKHNAFTKANKEGWLCHACRNKISNGNKKTKPDHGEMFKRDCPVCSKTVVHTSNGHRNDAHRKKRPCRSCSNKATSNNPEVIKKIQLSIAQRSKEHIGSFTPSYNKKACRIFEEINSEFGWKGLHAENGGEFKVSRFFLDYYEPEQNIVIEFDESHHREKKYIEHDMHRQQVIINNLQCQFIRIKDGQDWRQVLIDKGLYPIYKKEVTA